jgi:hypothetical protein
MALIWMIEDKAMNRLFCEEKLKITACWKKGIATNVGGRLF